MNSPHQREQLPDLLCDALTATERARVESHLAGCEQCTRELRALRRMQQSLAALPAEAPPDRIRANVRAALRENKKPVWALSALMENRARANNSPATDKNSRPLQSSERIGAPRQFAFPFALTTRPLAWGGAVAVAAVGLMLLARPSLQNNPSSDTSPVSETELASRADSGQSGAVAPKTPRNPVVSPAPRIGKPKTNQKASSKTNDAQSLAPMLPRAIKPEDLAPAPAFEMPAVELAPTSPSAQPPSPSAQPPIPRANTKPSRPVAPTKAAPKTPVRPAPATQQTKPLKKEDENFAPATASKPASPQAPMPVAPQAPSAPSTTSGAGTADNSGQNDFASPSPAGNAASADRARSDEQKERIGENAPPPSPKRTIEAAPDARKSLAQASSVWTGGAVTATLARAESQPFMGRSSMALKADAPILTLSVSQAIGDARLILRLPKGETPVWRGSMNAAPIKIKLDNPALAGANLRGGQKIQARLEQIDGEGNPKASTLFDLLWP